MNRLKNSKASTPAPAHYSISKHEALSGWTWFSGGIAGCSFPSTGSAEPVQVDAVPLARADWSLAAAACVSAAATEPSHVIGLPSDEEKQNAILSPADSARYWCETGLSIRDWHEHHCEEVWKHVIEMRLRIGDNSKAHPTSPELDAIETLYRPPSLLKIVESCRVILEAYQDVRLYTVRLIVRELAASDDEGRWRKLHGMKYLTSFGGFQRHVVAVSKIERFLKRDLMYLACDKSPIPQWRSGELSFSDVLLKKINAKKAVNVAYVLEELQNQGWPMQIKVRKELRENRLHQTLNSLNEGLKSMKFHADGSGTGVTWEITG